MHCKKQDTIIILSELAKIKLMNKNGYKENPDKIRTKIHRGTFSFSFFLEVCDSLSANIVLVDKN
jgi:hypothetical protein